MKDHHIPNTVVLFPKPLKYHTTLYIANKRATTCFFAKLFQVLYDCFEYTTSLANMFRLSPNHDLSSGVCGTCSTYVFFVFVFFCFFVKIVNSTLLFYPSKFFQPLFFQKNFLAPFKWSKYHKSLILHWPYTWPTNTQKTHFSSKTI